MPTPDLAAMARDVLCVNERQSTLEVTPMLRSHSPLCVTLACAYLAQSKRIATLEGALRDAKRIPGMPENDRDATLANAAIDAVLSGHEICPGCRAEVDPETCGCGSSRDGHGQGDGHDFVPMGCNCLRAEKT
jgi:hypothetical protein